MREGPPTGERAQDIELLEITDPLEIQSIMDAYFSPEAETNVTRVYEDRSVVYEGKPLVSLSFSECSGHIFISQRSIVVSHVGFSGLGEVMKKLTKYLPKEEPVEQIDITQYRTPNFGAAEFRDSGWTDVHNTTINLEKDTETDWNMAVDPAICKGYVAHGKGENKHLLKFDLPNIYDPELHVASKEVFKSLEYMPKGFREIEEQMFEAGYETPETALRLAETFSYPTTPDAWVAQVKSPPANTYIYTDRRITPYSKGMPFDFSDEAKSQIENREGYLFPSRDNPIYLFTTRDYATEKERDGRKIKGCVQSIHPIDIICPPPGK
jgi:hypothetical protein